MLVATFLVASLAAAPTYTVVVTGRVGMEPAAAVDFAELISQALSRQGQAILGQGTSPRATAVALASSNVPDPATCASDSECAATLGRIGRVDLVATAQLARVGAKVVVTLRLIKVQQPTKLAEARSTISLAQPAGGLNALATALLAHVDRASLDVPEVSPPPPPLPPATPAESLVTRPPPPPPTPGLQEGGSREETVSQFLVGVLFVGDVLGRSAGAEGFAGYRWRVLEGELSVRAGASSAVGLRLAFDLDVDRLTLFAGPRADVYPGIPSASLGVTIGIRVGLGLGFGLLATGSYEHLVPGHDGYRADLVVASAGIDWRI